METIYLCIIIFLFVLAVFDLIVGVSNDAVNFLNSAVGAKAASFKTILFIAGIGIFIGASLSNGMMDIARHGIYQPEHFYFAEIMCILLAVMLTDVVLLDVFNSMGMPTSTTVSLVFELLGGTFALSLIKVNNDATLALGDLINTDKALSVIMAIFVSVAIAFFFGMLVQWLARIVFTFNYTKNIKYSIGLFGGIAATSIIYFMLIKGLKDSSFMTPENKQWIQDNTLLLIASFFVFFTALMQVLHWLKVNVFKVVVLMQRPRQLHRSPPRRLLLLHRLHHQRSRSKSGQLPDDLAARPRQDTVVLTYRCRRHHGLRPLHLQKGARRHQDLGRPLPSG